MRISFDLSDNQARQLDALAAEAGRSRAALLRDAVDAYLSTTEKTALADEAFASWTNRHVNGVNYQQKLRDEW